MADLSLLRTAKQAVAEDLLTSDDYDFIKTAFLKAQQIKAGLDAGFIREEDYVQARDAFLHSLDFRVMSQHQHQPPVQQAPAPAAPSRPSVPPLPVGSGAGVAPILTSRGSGGYTTSTPRAASPSVAQAPQPTAAAPPPPLSARGPPPAPAPAAPLPCGPGTVAVPTDLPRIGRQGAAVGKKSMSGIGLNDNCINIFNYIKTKSSYKWIIFKIDDGGNEVIVEQLGSPDSTYEQFCAALPEHQPRYGVYDYAYRNDDTGQTINKLVFLHWAPEGSTIKSKMMYASTKDFLKGFLDGVGAEMQADSLEEMKETEMRDRVHQSLTRK